MIHAEKITKTYARRGKAPYAALRETSLTLSDTGLVLVTGHSGSGKTTLLNILSGLDAPTSGGVTYSGGCAACAYVFQDSRMIETLTLRENLRLAAEICGGDARAAELPDEYELAEVADHMPNELSAGERQRAAVLRAVACDRPVIYADEPTGDLDPENSAKVAELLGRESKKRLVVVVTHDREYFADLADREIVMKGGGIVSDVTVRGSERAPSGGSGKAALSFGNAALLAIRAARRGKARFISTTVALLLCAVMLTAFLSVLWQDPLSVKYETARGAGAVVYDLGKYASDHDERYGARFTDMTEADYAALYAEYGDDAIPSLTSPTGGGFFVRSDRELSDASARIDKIYMSSECAFPVLAGSATVGEGEAVICSALADALYGDAFSAVGEELRIRSDYAADEYVLTVGGVYGSAEEKTSVFMSASDVTNAYVASGRLSGVSIYADDGDELIYADVYSASYGERHDAVVTGTYPTAGEIGISDSLLRTYFGGGSSVTGTEHVFTVDGETAVLRVSCVFETVTAGTTFAVMLSDEEFGALAARTSGAYRTSFALADYDAEDIRELHAAGYCDDGEFSASARGVLVEAAYMCAVFGAAAAAFALLAGVFLALLAGDTLARSRGDLGLLRALGVGKGGLLGMLSFRPLMLLALVALVTPALCPLLVLPVELLLSARLGFVVTALSPCFPAALATVGVLAVFGVAVLSALALRLMRRSAVDIVYDRD